ncbi:MAG: N-acetyl-gamma-glutamyl-phosphate reductase [Clostridia bacterium]|nr:N-acetyl-gamma-glutamyl-phosphate reductase [Clostridia bacterium]
MVNIFIDGSAGTTGLKLAERLAGREGLNFLTADEEHRKDAATRRELINAADIAFLCLPDASAVESVSFIENPNTAVIDTSTAHRTAEGWTYGFPELTGHDKIAAAKRIANPGCHASGFIALIAPLTRAGLIAKDAALTAFSLTGYTGGGKKMIAQYEDPSRDPLYDAPRLYALTQQHKHLPEMQKVCGLETAPLFCPIVADFPRGMEVTVPLHKSQLKGTAKDIAEVYREIYAEGLVRYADAADADGLLSAGAMAGKDSMQVSVFGNDERILLVSRFDNLGKGASGAAIQNMNILLGVDEATGLNI